MWRARAASGSGWGRVGSIAILDDEALFFDDVKVDKGWYLATYSPPNPGASFATLCVSLVNSASREDVAAAVEAELNEWMDRYPIPLMATAFDQEGEIVKLRGITGEDHAIGLTVDGIRTIHWRLLKNDEFPQKSYQNGFLRQVYHDIRSRTRGEIRSQVLEEVRPRRLAKLFLAIWVFLIPATIAVFELFSPIWLAAGICLYSIAKAGRQALIMLGKVEKTESERQEDAREQRHAHFIYHCEQNPTGFSRLRSENFRRWNVEARAAEVKELREGSQ